MPNVFNEEELRFLDRAAQTRNADTWIKILSRLVDYLHDSRNIPVVANAEDLEKAMGQALISRRLAAKVIEEELIDLLKNAKYGEKKPAVQGGARGDYR